MAKLKDFIIGSYEGGLVRNKSDLIMDKNEFKNTLNLDFDESGKVKRRRGSYQYGDTKTGKTLDDSYAFYHFTLGSSPIIFHLAVSRESNGVLYQMHSTYLTAAVTTASTTLPVAGVGNFGASGVVEIEGDLIAYSGTAGNTFTGVTGNIRVGHPISSPVTQLISLGNTGVDTRSGVYFSVLNNLLIINGRLGSTTYNGSSIAAITDADEAAGLFATNYRDRIYLAGSGASNASGTRNGSEIRISFSDAGDATSWDIDNYFDVEDDSGESITGLRVNKDVLSIFKTNSIWSYDEVQLKERVSRVGAYNNKVIQKIGDLMYTFCPTGIWVTNGYSAEKISTPVDEYLTDFRPKYDTTVGRVVYNTFSGTFDNKYFLYIGDITTPETLSDVVLVYDTLKGNWTVYSGFTNFTHFGSFNIFGLGGLSSTTGLGPQNIEALFAGDTGGKYWRMFEDTFYIIGTTTSRGGDVIPNLVSDSTGTPIPTVLETPFLSLGSLKLKTIGYLTTLVEQGDFDISYRIKSGMNISDPISLGAFQAGTINKKLRNLQNEGEFISFKINSNTLDVLSTLNALVVRDIEPLNKTKYG